MILCSGLFCCDILILQFSGDKKNPDLQIKTTENVHMTRRHCKRFIIPATVRCLFSL